MKNTMKRLLCLLLALIMCAGLALGATADVEDPENGSGSQTGTGSGSENSDDNTGGDKDGNVYATAFTIDESSLELYDGAESSIGYNVQPKDYNMGIIWTSEREDIATVDSNGNVTAISEGKTKITATAKGSKEDIVQTCTVTVLKNSITRVIIKGANGSETSGTIDGQGTLQLEVYTKWSYGPDTKVTEDISWSSSNTGVAEVTSMGVVSSVGKGNATITAKTNFGDATFAVSVTEPKASVVLSGDGITGGNGKYTLTLSLGNSAQISSDVQPKNTFAQPGEISWDVPKNSVVTVDNGKITALSNGTVKITVKCAGATSAELTVTVGIPNKNITASTVQGSTIKGTTSIKTKLIDAYKEVYGSDPSDDMKLTITPSSNSSTYGTLYKNSATSNSNNKVTSSNSPSISEVGGMYFVPASAGNYSASYTLSNSDKTTTLLKGTITITVTSKKQDVTITLSDDSPYTFSSSSNSEKYAVTTLIGNAVKDATGSATYSYIIFGSPSTASKNIGTLYANSSKKSLDTYDSYTYKSGTGSIGNLYFVPGHKQGTYSIPYTAYSSGGIELCSGSLTIEVGVDDDGTVTVTLDDDSPYTFSSKTKKGSVSAAKAIDSMIEDEYYESYSYIMFGSVTSGSNVGTLYTDSDRTTFKTSYKYYRTGTSKDYLVSDLYFVPAKAGTYVREFTAYDKYEDEICEGTLKIVVPGDSSSADMDIYFNTTTGSTVSLAEDVFENWFRQEKGSSYKLACVTFDDASSSYGTFKHGSTSFSPGNDVKYYDEDYTGSTGSNAKYLDSVKFTAPNSTGYVSVDFTCYGGTSASSSGTKASGTFYIYVTKGSVKSVTYDVKYGTAATLKESDFSTVYKNAMSTSSSSSKFYIELLEIPSKGTVYYNYTSSSRPGTKLTSSNFDDYEFYVNSSSSYDSVEDLTYVPANTSGTVSVRYLACDTDGEPLYVGTISFSYGKDQTASISCGSEGYTFKTSDFYSSSDSDPVDYVTFRQPSTGELMLNYTNGRGVSLPSTVRLYTTDYTSGSYTLNSLSYIPKAGFSGDVKVDYTAVTESGSSQNGVLTITVSPKKGSSHFSDVTSTGSGAWASDAIDFAYKWGLVNGTGENTFSPDNTMTRAMLVTILYRSAGSPKVSGSCPFTDVAAGSYYYDAVIWAANGGIVTGTSATTFSPDRNVNREQVAAFLHRYAKYNGENVAVTGTINGYADKAFVSQYAIEPMSWAVQHGYITSTSGEELLLSPGGSATRAQVAVMLHRFLTY